MLTISQIKAQATAKSFERGQAYYKNGAIFEARITGNLLAAKCTGSYRAHYKVKAKLDDVGIESASCTCEYDFDGYCKHIVALLLTYVHTPETFEAALGAAELLKDLSRDELLDILIKLTDKNDSALAFVEKWAAKNAAKKTRDGQGKKHQVFDPAPYRNQVNLIIQQAKEALYAYEGEEEESRILGELENLWQTTQDFLEAGDFAHVKSIAIAVLEEMDNNDDYFDNDPYGLESFAGQFDMPLAEAILSEAPAKKEARAIHQTLRKYPYKMAAASAALEDGWGASSQNAPHDNEEHDVSIAKLNVLARRGDTNGYLETAAHDGKHLLYACKLVELHRGDEAAAYAQTHFTRVSEAVGLARLLRKHELLEEAFAVAARGLDLEGNTEDLSLWLMPMAEARGDKKIALKTWLNIFNHSPSLEGYKKIQGLAGDGWPRLQMNLKKHAQGRNPLARAEIALYEQEWDEAIEVAEGRIHDRVALTVADGLIEHRPEWVIEQGRDQAEKLIATVNVQNYPLAADWLARVKAACAALNQTPAWEVYLSHLKELNRRRPSLIRELNKL